MKSIVSLIASLILVSSISAVAQAETSNNQEPDITQATTDEYKPVIERENVENPNQDIEYPYIQQYLNEGAVLDNEGNGMLADRVQFEGGDKELITIATRDGSIFYIIIDNTAPDGSNVFFLNKVDVSDLMAIINSDNATTEPKVSEKVVEKKDDEVEEVSETNEEGEEIASEPTKPVKKDSSLSLLIIMAAAMVVIAGLYWFFKIKPGKGQHKGFDDDFEDDEEGDEEQIIDEDEDEGEDDM